MFLVLVLVWGGGDSWVHALHALHERTNDGRTGISLLLLLRFLFLSFPLSPPRFASLRVVSFPDRTRLLGRGSWFVLYGRVDCYVRSRYCYVMLCYVMYVGKPDLGELGLCFA